MLPYGYDETITGIVFHNHGERATTDAVGGGTLPAVGVEETFEGSASPVKGKISQPDYADDIRRLEVALYNGLPLQGGFSIDIKLRDLLDICPRKRRRLDSYTGLVKKLALTGVTLNITK